MIPTVSCRALTLAAVIGLVAIMEAAMLLSARQESQTSDEAYNLFAGYRHLTAGDFSICPGYPPLTKDVGALPFLVLRPHVPPMTDAEASDFRGGRIFLYANRADRLLFAARVAMTVFPLLLAVIVFLATREMFGPGPAFIALALIVFEPNILAHGPLVTNDVALACWLFAAVYAFWRYVVNPNAWRLAACGIAGGLTLAAKHSGIILFPILFLLALAELLMPSWASRGSDSPEDHPTRSRRRLALRLLLALIVVAAISVVVLWSFYGFRYSAKPAALPVSPTLASSVGAVRSRVAATAIAVAARAHLLPEAFLEGLAFFYTTASRPTYLLGQALFARSVVLFSHGNGDQIHSGVSPPTRSRALGSTAVRARGAPRNIVDAGPCHRLSRREHDLKSQYRVATYPSDLSVPERTGGSGRVEAGEEASGMGNHRGRPRADPRHLLAASLPQLPVLFERTVGRSLRDLPRAHGFERGLGPGSPGREALPRKPMPPRRAGWPISAPWIPLIMKFLARSSRRPRP